MKIVEINDRFTAESFFRDLFGGSTEVQKVSRQYIGGVDLNYIKDYIMKVIDAKGENHLILAAKVDGHYIGVMAFDIKIGDCHNKNLRVAYQIQMFTWGDGSNSTSIRLLKYAEDKLSKMGVEVIHLSFPEKAGNSERFHSLINRMGYEDYTRTYIKEI